MRNTSQGFDIIHNGRAGIKPFDSRERRANTRVTPFSFKRIQKPRFFPADVSSAAGMHDHIEVVAGAENIFAENPLLASLFHGRFHSFGTECEFSTDIYESQMTIYRKRCNRHPFDNTVRIILHQNPVFAGSRFRFIGIADKVARLGTVFRNETPFHPGRESRTAASANTRLLHFIDHLIGSHFGQDLLPGLVPITLHEGIDLDLIGIVDIFCQDLRFHQALFLSSSRILSTFSRVRFS